MHLPAPQHDRTFDQLASAIGVALETPATVLLRLDTADADVLGCAGVRDGAVARRADLLVRVLGSDFLDGKRSHHAHTVRAGHEAPGLMLEAGPTASLAAVPVRHGEGAVLGALCVMDTRERRWTGDELRVLEAFSAAAGSLIERERLREEARRSRTFAEIDRDLLIEASDVLASTRGYVERLSAAARLAVTNLADWCVIDLLEDGQVARMVTAHRDPEMASIAKRLAAFGLAPEARGGSREVIRTGSSKLYERIPDALLREVSRGPEHLELLKEIGMRSGIIVPLIAGGEVIGALTLVSSGHGRTFGAADLQLAEDFARRAAVAVENARLLRDAERARETIEHQAIQLESQLEALRRQAAQLQDSHVTTEITNRELRAANAALQDEAERHALARERLSFALEGSQQGLWDWSVADGETYFSARWEEMLGYGPGEINTHRNTWQDRLHPDERERVLEALERHLRGESEVFETEHRMLHRDGSWIWVLDRGRIFERDAEDRPVRMTGTLLDITARKQAEEQLRESEERLRQIAENIQEVFWMFDANFTRVIYVSPAYESLWGASLDSLYADTRSFLANVHPEDREALVGAMAMLGEGKRAQVMYRVVRDDGTIRWVRSRGFPVLDPAGSVYRVVGTTEDVTDRTEALLALRESEARFRTLFEQSPSACLIHDARGKIIQVNQSLCESLGYTREELLTLTVADIERAADEPRLHRVWRDLHETDPRLVRGLQRRKDGSTIDVEIWLRRIEIDGRRLILAESHDVTERLRAEADRAAAEEHYRRLVENAPYAIYTLDRQGRLREVNPASREILGREPAELAGLSFTDVVVEEDLPAAAKSLRATLSGASTLSDLQIRVRHASGEQRVLHVRATPIVEGGEIVGTHGIARDITEERAREEKMRLLTAALEGLEEGVSVARFDGSLIYANSTHARLFGYEAASGLPDSTIFLPDEQEEQRLAEIYREVEESGSWAGRVWRRRADDGRVIPLELIAGRVEQESGERLLFTIVRDITDEIRREQHLRRAERMASVGTLIGGVAHELNNPLHAIRSFAELMLMEPRSGEDLEALEIMKREADRAAKVVSDLRLIARDTHEARSSRKSGSSERRRPARGEDPALLARNEQREARGRPRR
jgi:PAS domain S-box-containing protein